MSSWTAGLVLLTVLVGAVPLSVAQPAASAPAASAAAGPAGASVAAPADEAMERARRQAANPMRMILEAGRNAAPAGKPTAVARPADEPGITAAVRQTVSAPPAAARAARELKLNSALMHERSEPAEPIEHPLAAEAAVPGWASEGPRAVPEPALLPPRVLSLVEPDLPSNMLQGARRIAELPVDLRLRADGSVAEVLVAAPAPQALVRAVVQALEQWRYEPQGRERLHRVQLIFNPER